MATLPRRGGNRHGSESLFCEVILRPTQTGAALGSVGKGTAAGPRAVACRKCYPTTTFPPQTTESLLQTKSPELPDKFMLSGEEALQSEKQSILTTDHHNLPFTGTTCRQSHFRLRVSRHRASVALCLSTGLENLFLPQPSSIRNTGPQLRILTVGSNQEARHCIYFRPPKICRLPHHTP